MRQKWILVWTIALCFSLALSGCDKGAEQKAELESAKAACEKAEAERDALKKELAAVTTTRDELQTQVTTLTDEGKPLRDQVDQLARSDKSLTEQVTGLTASNKQLSEQLEEVTGSRDQLTKEIAGLKGSNEGLQAQIDDLTKQRDAAVAKEKEAQDRILVLTAKLQAATGVEAEPLVPPTAATKTTVIEEAVERPTIHSFDPARVKISKGQSATLSWHVSHADRISIEPDVGSVSALGSKNIKPSKTTTYTLTATNSGGETVETCKVQVR